MPTSEGPVYLIHDGGLSGAALEELDAVAALTELPWAQRATPPIEARVWAYLSADQLREVAPLAIERGWSLGVLPHPQAEEVSRALGARGSLSAVARRYASAEPRAVDVLSCNGQVVFGSVVIGDVSALRLCEARHASQRLRGLFGALKRARALHLERYTLTTAKAQRARLAAVGLLALEHTDRSPVGRSFAEALSPTDGRFMALVLAPRSVFAYFWMLLRFLWPRKLKMSQIPDSVGVIQSKSLMIEGLNPIEYTVDNVHLSAQKIELSVLDQKLNLITGAEPRAAQGEAKPAEKETFRLSSLLREESASKLPGASLPLFSHASEGDYKELFAALRGNASLSSPYLVLMVLSVLLALTGLYANSAPVIIGAMILAPLMAPIVSLAMGLVRTDSSLIRGSLKTLGVGILIGLSGAILVAWLLPLKGLTGEMQARLHPNLLDLGVAILSGTAGAYAHAKEQISKSLAGVAIAVALVPPLTVIGVGIGWLDGAMAWGAFLLFATNLVGITLSAGLTFLFLGFTPFKLAKRGVAVSAALLALIIGPLYLASADLVAQGRIVEQIPSGRVELVGLPVELRLLEVRAGEPPLIRVALSAPRRLEEAHVDALKAQIERRVGAPVVLEAQLNLRR